MEGWGIFQVHSILYNAEERNRIVEALQDDPQNTYQWVENTLIYKFKLTNSIRLDYLILAIKNGYVAMSYGQLLNLIVEVCIHLIKKRKYFDICETENIWINLTLRSSQFNFNFDTKDYQIQFIGYKQLEQEASLDNIIYPIITQLVSLFPENYLIYDCNLQLYIFKILVKRPIDQMRTKLEQFRNDFYEFQTQLLTNERIRSTENLKDRQDLKNKFLQLTQNIQYLKDLDVIQINKHFICLKKLLNNLEQFRVQGDFVCLRFLCDRVEIQSGIQIDRSITLRSRFIEYTSDISEHLNSDLNRFQEQVNQRSRHLQLRISEEFKSVLQTFQNQFLKEHFLLQGWLNDESIISRFQNNLSVGLNEFRQNLEQTIYETQVRNLLIAQLNTQIQQYVNEVFRSLTQN